MTGVRLDTLELMTITAAADGSALGNPGPAGWAWYVDDDLHILCDSQYVINSVTKWMPGWKAKGWRKGDGKPVMNLDLLKQIDAALVGRRYKFEWVKGHVGHVMNEAADARARGAAEAFARGAQPDTGPGYPGGAPSVAEALEAPEPPQTLF